MNVSREPRQRIEFGKDFDVANDWHVLSGKKLARRQGSRQYVYLVIEGYDFDAANRDELSSTIKIGGLTIEPIVQVIDSNGEVFPTQDTVRWGAVIGFRLLKSVNGHTLTKDAGNIEIAIRSDEKFHCKSIGWSSRRLK